MSLQAWLELSNKPLSTKTARISTLESLLEKAVESEREKNADYVLLTDITDKKVISAQIRKGVVLP